jgi:16S rRNA (guanine966-N2)-methyltransferase
VRIVGGQWRGRALVAPAGRDTRPTSDRVREAVFDVVTSLVMSGRVGLEEHGAATSAGGMESCAADEQEPAGPLAGFTVVDLFAGSGAVGLEALSRGATSCTFVETARPALAALRRNLDGLGVPAGAARVLAREAAVVLREEAAAGRRYTLLFADPPYSAYEEQEGPLAAYLPLLVRHGGLAVVETARRQELRLPLVPLVAKTYGDTRVTFLVLPG